MSAIAPPRVREERHSSSFWKGYVRFLPRDGRPPEVMPLARVAVREAMERELPRGRADPSPRYLLGCFLFPFFLRGGCLASIGMDGSKRCFFLPIMAPSSAKGIPTRSGSKPHCT